MTDLVVDKVVKKFNLQPMAVLESYSDLRLDLFRYANTLKIDAENFIQEKRSEVCAAYGFDDTQQKKLFAFGAGIAVIPISGTLINRFGQTWGFVTGYNFIRSQFALALADEDVNTIVFDLNSSGGQVAGCFELAEDIFKSRGKKAIIGVIDSNCHSACYALASSCDKLISTQSGNIGSIGVLAMHVDYSKMLDEDGITITFIHSGAHKTDGNPYEPLPDAVKQDIQKDLDRSWADFINLVSRNRSISKESVRMMEARSFRAEDAITNGLIDEIGTPSSVIKNLAGASSGNTVKEAKMGIETPVEKSEIVENKSTEGVIQASQKESVKTSEKDRISGIIRSAEAEGRSKLADHLAFDTDMSVEAAKQLLSVAAKEIQAQEKPINAFKAHMDKDVHPNVGSDDAEGDEEANHADRILKAQAMATGRTFKKEQS